MTDTRDSHLHGHVTWTAQPAWGIASHVDAAQGTLDHFEGSTDTLLIALAALGRERLGLSAQSAIDVTAFLRGDDGAIKHSIIATL